MTDTSPTPDATVTDISRGRELVETRFKGEKETMAPATKRTPPPAKAARKATSARKAPAAKKAPSAVKAAGKPITTVLDAMKAAGRVIKEKGLVGDDDKPIQVTRENYRGILVDAGISVPAEFADKPAKAVKAPAAPRPVDNRIVIDVTGTTPSAKTLERTTKNRKTKTVFEIHDMSRAVRANERPSHRWAVVDVEHGVTAFTNDVAVANYGVSSPWGWSPKCKKLAPGLGITLPYPDQPNRVLGDRTQGPVVTGK